MVSGKFHYGGHRKHGDISEFPSLLAGFRRLLPSDVVATSPKCRALNSTRLIRMIAVFALIVSGTASIAGAQWAAGQAPQSPTKGSQTSPFTPLEQWKVALLSGDAAKIRAFYSAHPPARVVLASGEAGADTEIAFWSGLKVRRMKIDVVQSASPEPGLQRVVFQAEVLSAAQTKPQTVYINDAQLWQKQGEQWRIAATQRSSPSRLQQPLDTSKEIYVPGINARAEITYALNLATQQHKRVLVVFGANWCYDCHVLDRAFHRPDIEAVLKPYYEVVHVDVGQGDKNQDIMQQYHVPMAKGIPAIAVLDSNGTLLYAQQGGEFEKARVLGPEDVLAFLNKWKPA